MIKKLFAITIAEYNTLADVKKIEVEQADIVVVKEYLPEGIYHSQRMNWWGSIQHLQEKTDLIRSKKERKAVLQNKLEFEQEGFSFQTLPMTEELYAQFKQVYEKTTMQKERFVTVNLKEQILSKFVSNTPVYLVGMFKDDQLISGIVFSLRADQTEAWVSVGAKEKFTNKRGGVGGVLEIELVDFCLKNRVKKISHGGANNPTGLVDHAGIFEFKARYGYSAYPGMEWQTSFYLSSKPFLSDLVHISIHENQLCCKVLSSAAESVSSKYETTAVKKVIQLPMEEEVKKHREFILKAAQ